jgi:sialate O-acetylesterase
MKVKTVYCILSLLIIYHFAFSQVKLPLLISDNMVLQRDTPVKIWGWAAPDEKVTLKLKNKIYETVAGKEGNWMIKLSPMNTGGPYTIEIKATNQIEIKNILIGDVWICSGQSNMELTMKRARPIYEDVIAQSENPSIRYFDVPDRYNFNQPQTDLESGNWIAANPDNILHFSAVAYFFANALYKKNKIPVGLINASLGGSPIQAWISEEALKSFPVHFDEAQRFKDSTLIKQIQSNDRAVSKAWYDKLKQLDRGLGNKKVPWYDPDYDASEWPAMEIPGYWADGDLGPVNGVVWFRKEIDIPVSMTGKPAKLLLGRIVDADDVYINGTFVGSTGYQYPPRRYDIPSTLLKEGKNIIVVRVISNAGRGGFVEDKPYTIYTKNDTINLTGHWQYQLGTTMDPLPNQTFIRWKPIGLYNGMISPLINTSIKGIIWYQGESNAGNPDEYKRLFPALISDWRKKWDQGAFPFLYVQLPNFMEAKIEPDESSWAKFREVQLKTLVVPKTAMAVAIDIGEGNDIHPLNKKDVGERLALAAQKIAYGNESIVHSGPIYKSMKIEGNKIILSFSNIGSGLMIKGGDELKEFAIAGVDKKFVWASAKIEKNRIIVWNDTIPDPVAVRYAWADNPDRANLYNKEGLPASPFRTDNF